MTTTKRSFPLPSLPFRDSEVGRLVRCLLAGDFTVFLPLRDRLLEEGRWAEAGVLVCELASVVVRSDVGEDWRRPEDRWSKFAAEVLGVFLFDVFEPSAVIRRADELMTAATGSEIRGSLSEAARRIMQDTYAQVPPEVSPATTETLTVVTDVQLNGVEGGLELATTSRTLELSVGEGVAVNLTTGRGTTDYHAVYLPRNEDRP